MRLQSLTARALLSNQKVEHATFISEIYTKFLIGKTEGKKPLGSRRRWRNHIKIDVR
jgi:hypothetical protein